jgi:hypothetical protein
MKLPAAVPCMPHVALSVGCVTKPDRFIGLGLRGVLPFDLGRQTKGFPRPFAIPVTVALSVLKGDTHGWVIIAGAVRPTLMLRTVHLVLDVRQWRLGDVKRPHIGVKAWLSIELQAPHVELPSANQPQG